MMFGFGMIVHLAVSLIEERVFLRKFENKKNVVETSTDQDINNNLS